MLLPSPGLPILIINFLSTNLKIASKTLQLENFKKHLMIKKYHLLHDNQRNSKIKKTIPKSSKLTGLYLCYNCVYHKVGYIIPS